MAEEKNQEMTEETVETIFEEETEVNSSEQIETKEKKNPMLMMQ